MSFACTKLLGLAPVFSHPRLEEIWQNLAQMLLNQHLIHSKEEIYNSNKKQVWVECGILNILPSSRMIWFCIQFLLKVSFVSNNKSESGAVDVVEKLQVNDHCRHCLCRHSYCKCLFQRSRFKVSMFICLFDSSLFGKALLCSGMI